MSAFAQTDFNSDRYERCRPTYPNEFFQNLDNYHQDKQRLLVDVGCGPGTATIQMAGEWKAFDRIIGTDLSPAMIQTANQLSNTVHDNRLSFYVSSSDDFAFLGPNYKNQQTVDMITAAECAHYFDEKRFQGAVASNLRSRGTIAIFGYGDAIFLDYPKTDAIINDVSYGKEKLGSLWDEPGRTIAREMLAKWSFDPKFFTDIEDFSLQATTLRSTAASELPQKPLLIIREMTVAEYASNIRTWSAYHTWQKKFGGSKPELGNEFIKNVNKVYPELTASTKVRVAYSTYYKFARRI